MGSEWGLPELISSLTLVSLTLQALDSASSVYSQFSHCVLHNCPLCDVLFAGADIDVLCVAPRLVDREQFTNGFADELRHLDGVRDLRVRALSHIGNILFLSRSSC